MPKPLTVVNVSILAGQQLSGPVDLGTNLAIGLIMPNEWTPSVASIQVSPDGTRYFDLSYSTAVAPLQFSVAPGRLLVLPPEATRCARFMKVQSNAPQEKIRVFGVVMVEE